MRIPVSFNAYPGKIFYAASIFIGVLCSPPSVQCQVTINIHQPDSLEYKTGNSEFNSQENDGKIADTRSRVNVFVFSRNNKFNLANFSIKMSAELVQLFNKRKFKVIVIRSTSDLPRLITKLTDSGRKRIGTLWFDSHGLYKNGHSVFEAGSDTFYFGNIFDSSHTRYLGQVAGFCDESSHIAIGSCYGGASYVRPGNDFLKSSAMRGDSLMMGMGRIFARSPIYACESWVMNKPLLFGKKWGLAGYPIERKVRDEIYRPVWNRMGIWKIYIPQTGELREINTIYLSGTGEIKINEITYQDTSKAKNIMKKHIPKLKPNVYRLQHK